MPNWLRAVFIACLIKANLGDFMVENLPREPFRIRSVQRDCFS